MATWTILEKDERDDKVFSELAAQVNSALSQKEI